MSIRQDIKIIKADLSQHEFIYLVPLSDLHWDEPQSDHEGIQGYVDWIAAHDNAYTLFNGDLFTLLSQKAGFRDVFEKGDPGEKIELMPPDVTLAELEALFSPIADRILAACSGGHELNAMFNVVGADYNYQLMKSLGREKVYARDGGVLLIKTAPLTPADDTFFTTIFTHGWGAARTRGAKLRKAEYLSEAFEADIIVISHDHTQNITRKNILTIPSWDREKVKEHRTMLVSTGAFRGYAGYPFRSGYQPSDLGTPRVRIGTKLNEDGTVRKDIHASI